MQLVEHLDQLDRAVFLALNGHHAPWADDLMATLSEMLTWVPLYLFFLYVLWRRFGTRGLLVTLPVVALMVWCTDSGSVMLFKETVRRLRPCHTPELQGLVHIVNGHCGGAYGFVSSHASNHFGIAVFMARVLRGVPRWAAPALLLWAAVIAYSRIHLGVHFPGDVLVGGLYGAIVGALFARVHRRVIARFAPSAP